MIHTPKHKRVQLTSQQKQEIIKAYLGGESCKKIIARFACSQSLFWLLVKGLRVTETIDCKNNRIKRNKEIIHRYKNGEIPTSFCKELGVTYATVYQQLKKADVKVNKPGDVRKYKVNENYFNRLTPESAYWLGFILADGCVTNQNYLKIALASKDKDHLEKFKRSIQTEAPIKDTIIGKNKLSCLNICSKKICLVLNSYGINQRKSCSHGTPKIPSKLLAQMYLGYFDGDGWIHNLKKRRGNCLSGIISTKLFCNDFIKWARKNTKANVHLRKCKIRNMAIVCWSTISSIHLMYDLYNRTPIWLSRKRKYYYDLITELDNNKSLHKIPAIFGSKWKKVVTEAKMNDK